MEGERFNPFPGLRPFDSEETHLFFGREGQSDELLRRLRENRFLAVVGTSGSGKSSLVRAGLLPSLYGGFMRQAGSRWRVAVLRPGDHPIANFARALSEPGVLYDDAGDDQRATIVESVLRRGALGFVEAVAEARLGPGENLLAVVDQFEELFRLQRSAGERGRFREDAAAFVKLLLEAAEQQRVPIYVALTMRSDYLGDCSQFRDLPEAINRGQYLIPRMTRDEQRLAITGPVAVGGACIAPRLVNRLLNDAGDNPDQLPILQHALMRTWDCWAARAVGDEPLDLEDYEAIGGMADALSRHADEAYAELPDERRREIAEKMFRRLTERGPDNREIRRPTTVGELCAITEASAAELLSLVEVFRRPGRSFLMPPARVPLGAESLIDISHESLIRGWERLRAWVDEEAESARTYRRLAETAELHKKHRAGLWRDPDLELALEWWRRDRPNAAWARSYDPSFDDAAAFLDESRAARDAEAAEKERQHRQRLRLTQSFLGVLLALLFGASLLAVRAKRSENRALAAEQQAGMSALRESIGDQEHYGELAQFAGNVLSVTVSPQYRASRALALGYGGKHDSAVVEYTKALEMEPEFATARLNRCDEYLNLGQAALAVRDCEVVRAQRPHSPLVYLNLGVGYGMLRRYRDADAAFDSALVATRYEIFSGGQSVTSPSLQRVTGRESLTLRGDEARTAFYYGRASLRAYEGGSGFARALAEADAQPPSLDAVLNALNWAWLTRRELPDSAIPPDYGAFAVEGALWERAGSIRGATDEALRSYRAFQRAYARRPDARYADLASWVRGRVLRLHFPGWWSVAVPLSGDDRSATTLVLDAQRLFAEGEKDAALARLNEALAIRPKNLEVLSERIAIWSDRQAYDSVRGDADRILAADSLLADGYYYRALANWRLDATANRAAILADLARCLAYDPSHVGALSVSYWMLVDSAPDVALRRLERSNHISPGAHWVYYQMAVTQNKLHRYAEAQRSIEAALMLKRDSLPYYYERAQAELGQGKNRQAVWRRLAFGYRQAGELREQQGEREQAIQAYVSSRFTLRAGAGAPAGDDLDRDLGKRLAALGPDAVQYAESWDAYRLKQFERARQAIDSAVRMRPLYTSYLGTRVSVDSVLGRTADEIQDARTMGDLKLSQGDAIGAWFSYLAAARLLLASGPSASTGAGSVGVDTLAASMSGALTRGLGSREKARRFFEARIADASWPQGWGDAERRALHEAMRKEVARLASAR